MRRWRRRRLGLRRGCRLRTGGRREIGEEITLGAGAANAEVAWPDAERPELAGEPGLVNIQGLGCVS